MREVYQEPKEALVYIHGIYTPLDSALSSISQIMALGDFPPSIHPFVFGWPSGSLPIYFFQSLRAAGDVHSATGLRDFFASIIDAGYTKVNIVTHSMGTRCLLNCFEGNYLRDLFQMSTDSSCGAKRAEIVSLTFCSPEYPLPKFVAAGGTFDIIRQYCELITLYGDSQDQALLGSEFALSDNLLNGRVPSLGRSIGKHVRDPSYPIPSGCVYGSTGEYDSSLENKDLSYAKVNQVAGLANVAGFALSGSTISSQNSQPVEEPSVDSVTTVAPLYAAGLSPPPSYSSSYGSVPLSYARSMTSMFVESTGSDVDGPAKMKVYLDMDVIDTSFVDVNTGLRHSYYRLNTNIVDDIREIVLHKRRARARPGLMKQKGNVFIFLAAPSNVGLYPYAIRRGWINTEWWFDIKKGKRTNTLTYLSLVRRWNSKRSVVEYIGGLDKDNRPHGFGLWKDSAYHGENLSGLWDHGIPIGPFTSREQGSGFTTEKLRVAYASIRGEKTTDSADIIPTFKPLEWGVANVECSVAGGFFSFLPSVEYFFGDASSSSDRPRPKSAAECIRTLRTPLDYVSYHDVESHEVSSKNDRT
uniref:Alpha/beta hydrolase n=1 Tax=Globisporangium ultimum (strain ATCC 200006 / CBS 805.95 / DAOM BR144) TaxID=431595 RepID=K3XCW2_GLOUD